jgi:hypothetical protein
MTFDDRKGYRMRDAKGQGPRVLMGDRWPVHAGMPPYPEDEPVPTG